MDPSGIHLTLQFLGEVADERAGEVVRALGSALANRRACWLALSGAGAFPSLRRARVLWLGLVEEGGALGPLHAAVEAAMAPLGWQPENRPFQPHLTLGRVREGGGGRPQELAPELVRGVLRVVPPATGPRLHERVALVRSHLSAAGARLSSTPRDEMVPDPASQLYIPPSRIDKLSEAFGNSVPQTRSGQWAQRKKQS